MTLPNFIQVMILVCSSTVAFLVGSKSQRVRRIGFLVGLVGQPFWLATSWMNGQWAIIGLTFLVCVLLLPRDLEFEEVIKLCGER